MKSIILTFILIACLCQSLLGQARCNASAVISVSAGTTGTIVAAVSGSQIYVCGFAITTDTDGATAQFKAGSTNLTGAMSLGTSESITSPGEYAFTAPTGVAVTLTAVTGAITGLLTYILP